MPSTSGVHASNRAPGWNARTPPPEPHRRRRGRWRSARIRKQGLSVEVSCAEAPTPVWADAAQLKQVLTNLLVNARDAILELEGASGHIAVSTRQVRAPRGPGALDECDWIELSVSDSGPGIDEAHLPHIFEPFYTSKAKGKGMGLGLATVYAVVEHAGGRVEVESQKSEGATFRVLLPLADQTSAAAPSEDRAPLRVLVVDDQPYVRRLVERFLIHFGHRVATFDEPKAALTALKQARDEGDAFDAVLSDIVMPGMSGLDLARAVLDHPNPPHVVLMSGYSEARHEDHAELAHLPLLSKPFSFAELMDILRSKP